MATIGVDGRPKVRIVVLRRCDTQTRLLDIHTDCRSAKYAELQRHNQAQLQFWDSTKRIQLRLSGPVSLHRGDEVAAASWQDLPPLSRATYRVQPGPGARLAQPGDARPGPDDGSAVFTVIRLSLAELEWLRLAETGHVRAVFHWDEGGAKPMWLVP